MSPQKYIPSIDGMRAIAILIVVASHLLKDGIVPGGLGVTLFFFISGYLITGLLIDEQDRTGVIDIKRFYIRRFLRLAPALLTMVGLVSVTYFVTFGAASAKEVLAAVFYYMNFYQISQGAMPLPFGSTLVTRNRRAFLFGLSPVGGEPLEVQTPFFDRALGVVRNRIVFADHFGGERSSGIAHLRRH